MGLRRALTGAAALVAIVASTTAANAQELPREDAERFQRLLKDSGAAYREENYAASLELLEGAKAIYDHPDITYNMARALTQLDRCGTARATYEAYLAREDIGADDTAKARERLDELATTCTPYGTLAVRCTPEHAVVSVDDSRSAGCPYEARVEAGERRIAASAAGYLSSSRTVLVPEGESVDVVLVLDPDVPPPDPEPPWKLIGWTAGGAGAVLLTSGLILDATSARRASRLQDASGDANEVESLRAAGRRARTATIALYSLGLVGLAGSAGVLFVVAPQADGATDVAVRVTGRF